MNDQELSDLLQEAKAHTPKPSPRVAADTLQAWRVQFSRPSFFVRHWRMTAVAASLLVFIAIVGTHVSTGSPLPPEYDRPGIVASGSMGSRDGWRIDYYTVLRPWRPGIQGGQFTGTSVTEARHGGPMIFHRYLGDSVTKVYFGYDIVVQGDGRHTFRPLSVEPEEMPQQFRASGSRIVAVQELPANIFESGQNVAVTLLVHPTTGQRVIDYVHVDSSLVATFHHIIGNVVRAIHSHFEAHQQDR